MYLHLRDNGKITQKEMSEAFSWDHDHYDLVKCRQNMNFEEMNTEPSTEKMISFDYCEECLKSISNKILRKANAHCHLQDN